jgi:hypothetical protein
VSERINFLGPRGDFATGVLIHAVQAHKRIEDEQPRAQSSDRVDATNSSATFNVFSVATPSPRPPTAR